MQTNIGHILAGVGRTVRFGKPAIDQFWDDVGRHWPEVGCVLDWTKSVAPSRTGLRSPAISSDGPALQNSMRPQVAAIWEGGGAKSRRQAVGLIRPDASPSVAPPASGRTLRKRSVNARSYSKRRCRSHVYMSAGQVRQNSAKQTHDPESRITTANGAGAKLQGGLPTREPREVHR